MSLDDIIKQVPSGRAPESVPEEAFRMWARGEMSHEEHCCAQAMWVGENPWKYAPKSFAPLGPTLEQYVTGRVTNKLDYHAGSSWGVGVWFDGATTIVDENTHDYELLLWAKGYCQKVNHEPSVARIDEYLDRHVARDQKPGVIFKRILEMKRMDAIDRSRKGS